MRNRRGAFAIITAVVFFGLVTVGAVAVDFSRLWTLKNELQTSADAGALAGAIQLFPSRYVNATGVTDSAIAYATRNSTMGRTPQVDSVILGNWNQTTRAFAAGGTPQNALRVVTGYNMSGLVLSAFGVPAPRMRARATAWAEAPVATSGCMKPWAVPYENLMFAINSYRNIANTTANLTRPFDQVNDIAALNQMSAAQRTFNLKIAQNNNGNNGQINQGAATPTSMPGNYQAVRLGKYWDAATRTYANPAPQAGGQVYQNNISGVTCYGLSVGDSLKTETGNKVGPTVQGVEPAVCNTITSDAQSMTHGDCVLANGTIGAEIKAAFYDCGSGCTGQSTVGVKLLGSFKLMKMYPSGCTRNSPVALGNCERAEIVGIFEPIQATGPVGGGSTTLQKPILTQ